MIDQLTFYKDDVVKKTIIYVHPDKLKISQFNPRNDRPDEDIDRLAQRIKNNGFEVTRALWACRNGDSYDVFAGGTRLKAARIAQLEKVPIVLYEGLADEDIVKLADEDNNNDEYHVKVGLIDIWAHYAYLYDKNGPNWSQDRIAKAKDISQTLVSIRLKFNELPDNIKDFISQGVITEEHLREISKILVTNNFSVWLTSEQAQIELAEKVISKHRGSSIGIKPTVRNVKQVVNQWKEMIALAKELYAKLSLDWQEPFVDQLAKSQARTKAQVQTAYSLIVKHQLVEAKRKEEELAKQQSEAESERLRIEREKERQEKIQSILNKVICGDARQVIEQSPLNVTTLIIDPPYNQKYQSNRRVTSEKREVLEGDNETAFPLLLSVLRHAIPQLSKNSTVFVFSSQENEPEFRNIIKESGLAWKGTYIWDKPNHGTGDLTGSFAPQHECIIHATKGKPVLQCRPSSVLQGHRFLGTDHPTEKPLDLLSTLIEATTTEGDCVMDVFAGSGSTLLAAYKMNRDFFGCEINKTYHQYIIDALYDLITKESEIE